MARKKRRSKKIGKKVTRKRKTSSKMSPVSTLLKRPIKELKTALERIETEIHIRGKINREKHYYATHPEAKLERDIRNQKITRRVVKKRSKKTTKRNLPSIAKADLAWLKKQNDPELTRQWMSEY
jgi:hypothetical protein